MPAKTQACLDWTTTVESPLIHDGFDLIMMTNRISVRSVGLSFPKSGPAYEKGYAAVLRKFHAAHQRVVAVHDSPAPGFSIPDCLAAHSGDHSACDGTRASWLRPDPVIEAVVALGEPRIVGADLTDHTCNGAQCQAAVGGVPDYFDQTHLTATYSTTLGPYLAPVLMRALDGP